MPRNPKKRPLVRNYKQHTENQLEEALIKILDGKMSITEASKEYKISKGTLINRVHGRHGSSIGKPTKSSNVEELLLLKNIFLCGIWGFPLDKYELRCIAKSYLDSLSEPAPRFPPSNFPGLDWASCFLKRHKEKLTQRLTNNIKPAKDQLSREDLSRYHDELVKSIKNLPSQPIFNYDESNLADNPGFRKLIFRRGVKYPDNILHHSKSNVSIMACVSASGVSLPPYVVYKSVHLYDEWRKNGPKGNPCCNSRCCKRGSRYNRSVSGWFDGDCFTDWFEKTFLPHAKNIAGPKALIEDNLLSHFTEKLLKLCKEHEIKFICLPPNSTHICQPLDVSFFLHL